MPRPKQKPKPKSASNARLKSRAAPNTSSRRAPRVSNLTCPQCGKTTPLALPAARVCIPLHPCKHCGFMMRATVPNCCVACQYGDRKCPVHGLARKHALP